VKAEVLERGLIVARYGTEAGEVVPDWPVNPNGAWENAAAVRSAGGNAIAIMPHPERANWAWQVPPDLRRRWAGTDAALGADWTEAPGPGRSFFHRYAGMLREATV
jgi:phosphoribosylformylglycinamidine synthase